MPITQQSNPVLLQRTQADFWDAFEVQKTALEVSCLAFDGGLTGEAARLASAVFLLVGEGARHHKSILDHLGIKGALHFRTTVPEDSKSGSPLMQCTCTSTGQGVVIVELEPKGRSAITARQISFVEWWSEVVMRDGDTFSLTRENIVRILRDKNGGAHYDANVNDPLIAAALKGEITGFRMKSSEDAEAEPIPFGLENTMRQIAEEIRRMIKYLRISHDTSIASGADPANSIAEAAQAVRQGSELP